MLKLKAERHLSSNRGQALLETLMLLTALGAAAAVYSSATQVSRSSQRKVILQESVARVQSDIIDNGVLGRGSDFRCRGFETVNIADLPLSSISYVTPTGDTVLATGNIVGGLRLNSINLTLETPIVAPNTAQSDMIAHANFDFSDPAQPTNTYAIQRTVRVDLDATGVITKCLGESPATDYQNVACNSILDPLNPTLAADCRNTATFWFMTAQMLTRLCGAIGQVGTFVPSANNNSSRTILDQLSDPVRCGGAAIFIGTQAGPVRNVSSPLNSAFSSQIPFNGLNYGQNQGGVRTISSLSLSSNQGNHTEPPHYEVLTNPLSEEEQTASNLSNSETPQGE